MVSSSETALERLGAPLRVRERFLRLFWTQARRSRASISILMLDVDDFKKYNDANGHLRGDDVLRRIADAISGAVSRTGDIVARFGGEEFAVLLLETPLAGAAVVAERMRARVEALAIPAPSGPSEWVTVSVGAAAAIPERDVGPETLLAEADELLYAAKSAGKNLASISPLPATGCGAPVLLLSGLFFTVNNATRQLVLTMTMTSGSTTQALLGASIGYTLQVSPAPAVATFADVPVSSPQFKFAEALAAAGITAGCGGGNYCPDAPITRGQMAVLLSSALGLHFPN